MIEAHHDPRLLVQVLNRRPLRYSAGADPSLDRPAHVRAASSLVRVGDSMLAIQDDAHFVALIDPDSWEVRAIPLPPGPGGKRQFDDLRGTKGLKLDLEACVVVPEAAGATLIAFGSGATPQRERVLVMRAVTAPAPDIRLVEATALYSALRAPAFAGSELNLEGAVLLPSGETLRLFQRGNGAPRGALQPVDATCDIAWPDLAAYLDDPTTAAPPPLQAITRYHLGLLDGARLTFTDATPGPNGILYCAAAERSPNAVDDGEVVGSALGLLPPTGAPRYAPIVDFDGALLPLKIEGLLLDEHDPTLVFLVADADDPLVPSELLTARLIGPWFDQG
jgi:hypothetical protein